VLPLPQDETLWDSLHLVFATASGTVRRNKLSDFGRIRSSGLIAMKLDEGDRLIGVATCREGDDVLLATRLGRCLRFQISDDTLRVFAGRESAGVRGIKLSAGDEVNSLCVLRHVDATVEKRAAYLREVSKRRRSAGYEEEAAEVAAEAIPEGDDEAPLADLNISEDDFATMGEAEEILLTVTDGGFGKRSSAYDYRVTGRGGQGIANITLSRRNGTAVVATLPVRRGDDVMLVTDVGRLIRVPADQVRITARQSMGVTLFRVSESERVTSVFPVLDDGTGDAPTEIGVDPGAPPEALEITPPDIDEGDENA
jgi:DNA gyrase subunit A